MNPGDSQTTSVDELLLDEQTPSAPVEPAMCDDEFGLQQQRINRLNQYYDEVVAELRALLDQD